MPKFNNGIFFVSKAESRRTDKSPEFYGNGKLPMEVLDELIAYNQENPQAEFVPMNCAGWKKRNKDGPYVALNFSVDKRERDSDGRVIQQDNQRRQEPEEDEAEVFDLGM